MSKKVNLESDAKYRSYSVALDKCLKSFEYSNEWADLITSLGRLMKLIQQNSRYKIIPKKRLLGKRLAQCLHPALPSGVHCKTLECFDLILPIMGPENLATDIAIYGPCLFSLLGPSAMSVKPPLFDLFENYFLPLGEKLRPAFLGLLQGLLPGLEEGSEFFERGNNIIERFCRAVEPEFFYTCLWQVLIQAPSVRHFGTAFILNHFNKRRHISTQAFFFGTSTTVMMESLRCLLSDTVVLVQRDTLDFVILALPLHVVDATASRQQHPLCGQISPTAMRDLLGAALTVLLRKDASLNRRLFIWLLGSQPTESADSQQASTVARIALQSDGVQSESDATLQLQYFKKFGLELLIGAIQSILQSALSSPSTGDPLATNRSVSYRPFRLIAGLLNRSEVGSLLMEKVLVDFIFFTLKMYHRLQDNEERTPEPSPPSSTSSSPKEQRAKAIHQTVLEMLAQYQSHAIGQSEITCGSRPVALAVGQPHLQSQRGTRHLSDHADPSTAMARPSAEADFMREAELFFSNLESAFLWPFLESHFTRLLSHEVANSTERENQEAEAVAAGVVVNLRNWIAAVRFLVEHLPIDTYPEVRGHYLPRMVSSLAQKLSAHMGQLKLAEIADFISLLSVLIGHTQEHMVTMFDQSLADVTRSGSVSRPPTSPFPPGNVVPQREKELRLIASTVGDVRLLLGAFFKHFLCTSQAQIDAGLEFLQPSDKDLTNLENNFCTFLGSHDNDGHVVNDMFAQLCRLVVDMCNVPLVRPTSFEDFDFNDLFRSGCKKDDKFGLPEWLACLVAGGALSSDFDLKAICLHTLLDLVEASTSIHGWVSPGGATQWDRCRLLLPVLSPEVLTTIAWRLDLFPIVGVSLWFFLDDSSCLEDTAALLNRVLAVAPNQKASRNVAVATETVVEDFIVTRMLSTDSAVRVEAHRRFALLWHLLRRHSSSSASRGRASADGEASSQGPWASSWRRTAMGLPPVSNEASNVAAFNRCLLILLDSVDDTGSVNAPLSRDRLSLAPDPPESVENTALQIRQATLTWLSTALLTGQVGRVVAPIFGALLHPGTARTSLVAMRERRRFLRRLQLRRTRNAAENGDVHASDADTDSDASSLDEDADEQDEEEEYDSNICALSGGTPSDELHFFLSPTSEAFSKPKKTPKKSADDDVFDEKYRPVDVMANLQVDSHSNGNPGGRERSQTENARRDVALALLSQLLSPEANVAECNGAKTLGVSSLFQTGHSSVKVLPVHEHLLVYLHTFDFNQVAYALTRIRAILTSHVGGLFLLALAASPTAARPRSHPASVAAEPSQFASCDFPKLFGTSLPDLLARHYRCLLGGGDAFVRHSTMEEIERILQSRMPCLLDVLVFVCTAFLCSVAAPSALPDLVPNDGAAASANANVRQLAAEVLHLVAERLAEIDANEEALTSSWPKSGTDAQSTNQMAALIAKVHSPRSSWISAVIQRSGLSQAVLHCLATCVELSHLPASFDCEDEGGLSLCLRLLRANSCTASHRQAELQTLLGLTLSLLQLTRQVGLPKPAGSAPATSMNRVSKVLASAKKTTAAAASSSPSPRKGHLAFGGGLPWCLPGRPSNVVAVLKRLGQTASPLLLGVAGSRFIVCSEGMRHVASQPLLLNTLRLALCPGGRVDLHPAWFRFLLKSLPCWGAATAYMLNLVIMQMGGSLQLLAEPFYHGLAPTWVSYSLCLCSYHILLVFILTRSCFFFYSG
uniref:Dopey_N domain-containing protein n=1 Tax=Mesocestoides corti TaxID=53468 RepID=A0A5K3F1W4_MESCO